MVAFEVLKNLCPSNKLFVVTALSIAEAIANIGIVVYRRNPHLNVILSGILPRDRNCSSIRRQKIERTNDLLRQKCDSLKLNYLEHDEDWVYGNGDLNGNFYFKDHLHLLKPGNEKLATEVKNIIIKVKEKCHINMINSTLGDHNSTSPPYSLPSPFPLNDEYAIGQSEYLGRGWDGLSHQQSLPQVPSSTPSHSLPYDDDFPPLPPLLPSVTGVPRAMSRNVHVYRSDVNVLSCNLNVPVSVSKPVPRKVNTPVFVSKPVTRNVNVPVSVSKHVSRNVNVPISHNVNVPVSVSKPVSRNVNVPVSHNVNVPVSRNVNVPVFVSKPVSRNVNVHVSHYVNVPVSRYVNVPVSRNVNVPVSRNVNVPVSRNVNVPVSVSKPVFRNVNVPVFHNVNVPVSVSKPVSRNVNVPVSHIVNVPVSVSKPVSRKVNVHVSRNVNVPFSSPPLPTPSPPLPVQTLPPPPSPPPPYPSPPPLNSVFAIFRLDLLHLHTQTPPDFYQLHQHFTYISTLRLHSLQELFYYIYIFLLHV